MSVLFTNPEYDYYCSADSFSHTHMASSVYEMQNHTSKGFESNFHLPYDEMHYPALMQEFAPTMPEQFYFPEELTSIEPQYIGHSELVDAQPPVFSWPVEYFIAPAGTDFVSGSFELPSPSDSSTPDLVYSATSTGSIDDPSNVFDMHFGAAIGSNFRHHPRSISRDSGSLSPVSDTSAQSSRRFPIRTPSPPSDSTSHLDHRRRFPCLIAGCARRFTSQYTLKVHMEAHKPKPKVSFPCTLGCSERFSRQHDRLRHEVAKHGKVCEFSCEDCGRFFSSGKTLGNHRCPVAQGSTRWVHN